jgi:transposase
MIKGGQKMRRLDMLKAREILRLKFEVGLSLREIAKSCNCGKTSVEEILKRAKDAGITWPIEMKDKQLMPLLYPPSDKENKVPMLDNDYIFYEMKKKNVTLMLLWEEYKEKSPNGLMYSQFCDRYRQFKKDNQITMHIKHKAGEEMQVDWAGTKMSYVEPKTGEIMDAYVFVAVLPASNYPFAYAYGDMKMPNWIDAHVKAFEYFGGVPKITIPDNTKTAVTAADHVDPVLNKSYNEMAQHYRTTLIPARPVRPKDKAADEGMVGIVSRRIIAALRNRQFFSIYDMNQAIKEELVKLINRPFQKMEGNRITAFEKIDKPMLQPLPKTRYEYSDWKEAKIQFNYHVEYDGFFYSTHYSNVGKKCSVRATNTIIEIYLDGERIAAYPRNYNTFKRYKTLPEHMPESHKAVSGWSNDRFLSWAEKIGPYTRVLIQNILESREYPVQTYRSCMGIMRYSKNYSNKIMEYASKETLEKNTCSFKYFSIIIKQAALNTAEKSTEKIIQHDNVRGIGAYTGGGINA